MAYFIDRKLKMNLWERIYLPEIIRGLLITGRHFLRNFIHMRKRMTIEYPEQKHPLPAGYRAEHRLMQRENGEIRCTACMLCVTVCPANCIEIEAEEVADPLIEKRARKFKIDMLRCVFCGLCVEACPCDAIRMDTAKYENVSFEKSLLIYTKNKLIDNSAANTDDLSCSL
ncbi:MAG: NADH-quinone oxidoreductase subunit I [Pseudomonadota bacterium]